jgi:hypothetical protein
VSKPRTKEGKHPQPVVLPINLLGWLAPAVLVGLAILALGLLMNPSPVLPVISAVFAVALLGFFGYRRRAKAHLTVDRHGMTAVWRQEKIDMPWRSIRRIKGSTVWFEASNVMGQPGKTVPAMVRRAVIAGKTPKVRLITFTRSLADGEVGAMVRRYRPDLLVAAESAPAEPSSPDTSPAA